ncbi:MAG: NAD(P)-dependent oxidoreductase [Bacteroidales bacterium]
MKILVATDKPFAPVAVNGIREIIEGANMELVLLEKYTQKQQLLDAIAEVDAVIIRSDIIDNEVLDAAKKLKIVVRAGAGYDNVDLASATAHNVCVMNTPGQNANAVAELVFGMILFQLRNHFNGTSGFEAMGKSIGLMAYGNVAHNVARIARGFNMTIYAYDPFLTREKIEAEGIIYCETPAELFEKSHFVSLHIPATPQTKESINYELVSKMPKGGMLINTARKEVIHESELLRIMEERKDLSYVSDIAPSNAAEFSEKVSGRFMFTPKKMGAQTEEANINAGLAAAKQIVGFINNGEEKFRVNK